MGVAPREEVGGLAQARSARIGCWRNWDVEPVARGAGLGKEPEGGGAEHREASESVMARVSVLGVSLLENPSPFDHPLRFQVQFECGEALPHGEYQALGWTGTRSLPPTDRLPRSRAAGRSVTAGRFGPRMFGQKSSCPASFTKWLWGPKSGAYYLELLGKKWV